MLGEFVVNLCMSITNLCCVRCGRFTHISITMLCRSIVIYLIKLNCILYVFRIKYIYFHRCTKKELWNAYILCPLNLNEHFISFHSIRHSSVGTHTCQVTFCFIYESYVIRLCARFLYKITVIADVRQFNANTNQCNSESH